MRDFSEIVHHVEQVQRRWSRRVTAERVSKWRELYKQLYLLPEFASVWTAIQPEITRLEQNVAHGMDADSQCPGVTGEQNDYYLCAKGIGLWVVGSETPLSVLVLALAGCVLTGNGLILAFDPNDYALEKAVKLAIHQAGFSQLVLVPKNIHFQTMVAHPGLSFLLLSGKVTDHLLPQAPFMQQLMDRNGSILQPLLVETLLSNRPIEDLLLHLVTERTRSINLTAIGGNIALLQAGSA